MKNLILTLIVCTCLYFIGITLYDIASVRRSNSSCIFDKWVLMYNVKLKLIPANIYFLPLNRDQEAMLLKEYNKYFFSLHNE